MNSPLRTPVSSMNRTASRRVSRRGPGLLKSIEQGLDLVATEVALAGNEGRVGLARERFGRVVGLYAFASGEPVDLQDQFPGVHGRTRSSFSLASVKPCRVLALVGPPRARSTARRRTGIPSWGVTVSPQTCKRRCSDTVKSAVRTPGTALDREGRLWTLSPCPHSEIGLFWDGRRRRGTILDHSHSIVNEPSKLLIGKALDAASQTFTVIFAVKVRSTSIGEGFRAVLRKLTFRDLSVPERPASPLLHLAVSLG